MNDKQQLSAMGEHLSDQHPMCLAKRVEELEALLREGASVICEFAPESSALIRRIDDALEGAPVAQSSVPEGWQLVPVEPTNEMIHPLDQFMRPTSAREIYRAMLAAAPAPEAK